jgi:uncharacterized membrane protein YidH (DUF202 family)
MLQRSASALFRARLPSSRMTHAVSSNSKRRFTSQTPPAVAQQTPATSNSIRSAVPTTPPPTTLTLTTTTWRAAMAPRANTGSVARDHLANERTFLAWMRTGVAVIGMGMVLDHICDDNDVTKKPALSIRFDFIDERRVRICLAPLIFLTTGAGVIVAGTARCKFSPSFLYLSHARFVDLSRPHIHTLTGVQTNTHTQLRQTFN